MPTNKNGEYEEEGLDRKLNNQVQNEAALQFFKEVRERDRTQSIKEGKPLRPLTTSAYASSVAHAQQLARVFSEAGISAAAVWGEQDGAEKDEIMKKWASGEIEAVFSKDILVRGLDLPRIRMIMNIAPTASAIVEKQRCGRGLRLDPEDPNKHTIIADFVYINTKSASTQVTYPELLGSAQIVRKVVSTHGVDTPSGGGGFGNLDDIEIEGLKVITNPEDIMTILNKIRQELGDKSPPPGWKVMGQKGLSGTLADAVGRKTVAILPQIPVVLSELEVQAKEKGEPFFPSMYTRSFTNKAGKQSIFYSPELERILAERLKQLEKPPEGWLLLGERRVKGSLSDLIKREPSWILRRLPEVITDIQKELVDNGIPIEEQAPLIRPYRSKRGGRDYYSPSITEKLKEIADTEIPPPPGWYLLGEGEVGSLTGAVRKSTGWVLPRIPLIVKEIQAELEEKGIPIEQQPILMGRFVSHGKDATCYSPLILEKLQQEAEQLKPIPKGWMGAGQGPEDKSGISGLISGYPDWVRRRIGEVTEVIQKKWKDQGISQEAWPSLVGEFDSVTGKGTFYSPEVIQELQSMAEKEEYPPSDWLVLGDRSDMGALAGILGRDRAWAERRIPRVLEQIEREMEEKGIPVEKRPKLTGEYLSRSRHVLLPYFSPVVLERLRAIQESELPPPSGWLTVSDSRLPGSLSALLGQRREKVLALIPEVLSQIQEDYKNRGVALEEQPQLYGEFYGSTGRGIYYAPEVIERLIKLNEKAP